jgi:hypothetical protein
MPEVELSGVGELENNLYTVNQFNTIWELRKTYLERVLNGERECIFFFFWFWYLCLIANTLKFCREVKFA